MTRKGCQYPSRKLSEIVGPTKGNLGRDPEQTRKVVNMMNETRFKPSSDCNLLTIDQAVAHFNLNRNTILRLASECGAKLKIGRSARYRKDRLEEYLKKFEV